MFDLIWAMSDHPRGVIDGPGLVFKVRLDRIYCFGDIAALRFWRSGLKLPGYFRHIRNINGKLVEIETIKIWGST